MNAPLTWRQRHLSRPILNWYRKLLPPISATERDAIAAGTVWWDADLFSGKPDWAKLRAFEKPELTAEEQAFLDGPVETLCGMLDDWEIRRAGDLSEEVWSYHPRAGLHGDDHPQGAWRARLLGADAQPGGDEGGITEPGGGGDRDGAQLARPGRALDALRHRRAARLLSAAARQGAGDPVLRADGAGSGIGRGLDPGQGRRLLRRAHGQAHARHARHLEQALHHAGAGGDDPGSRVPALRSRPPAVGQGRHRHHARARSDRTRRACRSGGVISRRGRRSRTARRKGAMCSSRWTTSSAARSASARAGAC